MSSPRNGLSLGIGGRNPDPLMPQAVRTRLPGVPRPFTVAAQTVGGQARRRKTTPANKK
jgi:hypothetical protein